MCRPRFRPAIFLSLFVSTLAACATAGTAQSQASMSATQSIPGSQFSYADLVDFSLGAELVAVVQVDEQITVPAERAPGLEPGKVRLYLEAETQGLLASPVAVGESLAFLIDLPLNSAGNAPKLEKQNFVIFARRVPDRPAMVQLLSPDSMIPAGPEIESRIRRVLTQLAGADAMPAITGVKDVIWVPGNLAGESETQVFVETQSGEPVSLSVIRRPQMPPAWGISLGEIVDQNAAPPEPETILWYRFACELPASLPQDAFLQNGREARASASADYAFVLDQLGPCTRSRG